MLANLNMGTFKIFNAAAPVAATDLATKQYVDSAIPASMVAAFVIGIDDAPPGWLVCDGASVSTTTYINLYNSIGYNWGGSGANFNLPDFRGCFLRGQDRGRGLDFQVNRFMVAGSFQASYLANHFHVVNDPTHAHSISDPTHGHPISQTPHTHSVSDPGHTHTVPNASLAGGVNIGAGSGFNLTGTNTTNSAGTGISIVAGLANVGANTGAVGTGVSVVSAFTGVAVGNVSTGNVNPSGAETTVQNYPVLWCIKY